MDNTGTMLMTPPGEAFAGLIGRLLLTQGEVRKLLALDNTAERIAPNGDCDSERMVSVAAALSDALRLVGDDALVQRWLRASLPRRGGASPLSEAEAVRGDRLIRFVLCPHPIELVRLVADLQTPCRAKVAKVLRERDRAHA